VLAVSRKYGPICIITLVWPLSLELTNKLTDGFSDYAGFAANLSIRALLPGSLRSNIDECAAIATRLNQPNGDLTIPLNAVHGLLDPPADASQMTHDESLQAFVCPDPPTLHPDDPTRYAGEEPPYSYDPRHMLCSSCVTKILSQRFYSWWLAERKSPRVSSKSIVLRNIYVTDSYRPQFPIWKTVGGGGNVELSESPPIQ
jgi:hypothetical protein